MGSKYCTVCQHRLRPKSGRSVFFFIIFVEDESSCCFVLVTWYPGEHNAHNTFIHNLLTDTLVLESTYDP